MKARIELRSWPTSPYRFSAGPRHRSGPERDRSRKKRFGLPENAEVFSCYEAGRDGFWLHRFLHHHGINNVIA